MLKAIERSARVQWFTEFSKRLGVTLDPTLNLLIAPRVEDGCFHDMREALLSYIRACLGNPDNTLSEEALLEMAGNTLANRTPNGVLIAKREFDREFNHLHKVTAGWLHSLLPDELVYQICCPIVVRLVKGERNLDDEARPYSSTKLHSDIWTGEPSDFIGIRIPVLGDIERTTIAFYHPPDDFEERYHRSLTDYDEIRALEARSARYPLNLRPGYAYFVDGTMLHKTVKLGGTARVSIHIEFRRPTAEMDRQEIERLCDPGRLKNYIDRDQWYQYGSTRFLRMKDTYEDAVRGIMPTRLPEEPPYEIVETL